MSPKSSHKGVCKTFALFPCARHRFYQGKHFEDWFLPLFCVNPQHDTAENTMRLIIRTTKEKAIVKCLLGEDITAVCKPIFAIYVKYLKSCPDLIFSRVSYMRFIQLSMSASCTISTVVCMYFNGSEISAEATP